jgi:hypothetical protein
MTQIDQFKCIKAYIRPWGETETINNTPLIRCLNRGCLACTHWAQRTGAIESLTNLPNMEPLTSIDARQRGLPKSEYQSYE